MNAFRFGRSGRWAVRLAFAMLAAGTAAAATAGELVVIRSDAAGLKPGQVVDAGTRVTIAADRRVTLVDEAGAVHTLSGPFSGAPPGAAARRGAEDIDVVRSLAGLLAGGFRTRAGLFVGAPDPWMMDVVKAGPHCVRAGATPQLWRGDPSRTDILTLKLQPSGPKVSVDWSAGNDGLDWPSGLPLADGRQYLVSLSSRISATRLVVRLVPSGLPSEAHRAAWMADHGCVGQARALVATLE